MVPAPTLNWKPQGGRDTRQRVPRPRFALHGAQRAGPTPEQAGFRSWHRRQRVAPLPLVRNCGDGGREACREAAGVCEVRVPPPCACAMRERVRYGYLPRASFERQSAAGSSISFPGPGSGQYTRYPCRLRVRDPASQSFVGVNGCLHVTRAPRGAPCVSSKISTYVVSTAHSSEANAICRPARRGRRVLGGGRRESPHPSPRYKPQWDPRESKGREPHASDIMKLLSARASSRGGCRWWRSPRLGRRLVNPVPGAGPSVHRPLCGTPYSPSRDEKEARNETSCHRMWSPLTGSPQEQPNASSRIKREPAADCNCAWAPSRHQQCREGALSERDAAQIGLAVRRRLSAPEEF